MAFGDIGGPATELVVTCKTPEEGPVDIAKGDALKLTGPYTVTNDTDAEDPVFGEALAPSERNGAPLPVRVRGISLFRYTGAAPAVDGVSGVLASATAGAVKAPDEGAGSGRVLKVDEAAETVHVLL